MQDTKKLSKSWIILSNTQQKGDCVINSPFLLGHLFYVLPHWPAHFELSLNCIVVVFFFGISQWNTSHLKEDCCHSNGYPIHLDLEFLQVWGKGKEELVYHMISINSYCNNNQHEHTSPTITVWNHATSLSWIQATNLQWFVNGVNNFCLQLVPFLLVI